MGYQLLPTITISNPTSTIYQSSAINQHQHFQPIVPIARAMDPSPSAAFADSVEGVVPEIRLLRDSTGDSPNGFLSCVRRVEVASAVATVGTMGSVVC